MRIKYIDALKGFAILLVIIGHICPSGIWISLIYSFHMALFYFLSGLVVTYKICFTEFIYKKFRTLLLPFISFVILHSFFFNLSISDILFDNVKDGLWFIYVLFFTQLIDYTCFKISLSKSEVTYLFLNIIIVLLLVVVKEFSPAKVSSLFSLSYLATNYPFYFLGRICKRLNNMKNLSSEQTYSIIQFTATASFFIIWGLSPYYIPNNEFSNMYLRLSGTISLVMIFKQFNRTKLLDFFSIFGKETLAIYLLHFFFIRGIANDMQYFNQVSPFIQILICIILSIIIATVCIISAHIIKSNKYTSFILLGIKKLSIK